MRALIGLVATIGLLSAIAPATVSAARPTQYSVSQTFFGCDVTSTAGEVSIYVQADASGVFVSVLIWAPGTDPEMDLPTIISDASNFSFDGSILTGSLELVRVEESDNPEEPPVLVPAGTARISAELIANGAPIDFGSTDDRDGNVLFRSESWIQLLDVAGTLALDLTDGTVAEIGLSGTECDASTYTIEWFGTNPNAWVTNDEQVFLSCEWSTETGSARLLAITDPYGSWSELIVVSAEGALVGLTAPVLNETTYQAYADLFDPGTKQTVGTVTAEASLAPSGERITRHERVDSYRFSVIGESLHVDGTVTLDARGSVTTLPLDNASCDAGDVRVQVQQKMRRS